MAEYFDLVKSLQELLTNRFTPKLSYTTGLLGDGLGNVTVPDRPDKSYARFNRASTNYFEIFNVTTPHINNWPVLIGEYPWQPGLTQVIGTDWEAYQQSGWGDSFGGNSPHAPTHEWPDGSPGSDPLNVYLRSIVPFRTYAGSTGTTIYTNAYEYEYQGSGHVWGGVPGIDLSPVVSSMTTGTMRFMGVYLNPATNLLGVVTGSTTVFTSAFDPPRVQFPGGVLPSARVRVYGSQSNITEFDFRDARQPFSVVSTGTSGGGGSPSGNAGGDLTGTYPNPTVAGLWNYPLESGAPSEGDVWMFSGSSWRHLPLGEIGGGNVWPKAGEVNISDTAYAGIDDFLDALAAGDQGIIGEDTYAVDHAGGHGVIASGVVGVKGSGIGVSILTDDDTYTLEVGSNTLEDLTVANTKATGGSAIVNSVNGGEFTRVRAIATATSGTAQGFFLWDYGATLKDCEASATGGATNRAVYVLDSGSSPTATVRGGYFVGDVVADGAGATLHLDGPVITGSVTEANGGSITGHYYNAAGDLIQRDGIDIFPSGDNWGLWDRLNFGRSPQEHWSNGSDDIAWTGWASYTGFVTPATITYPKSKLVAGHTSSARFFYYRPFINANPTIIATCGVSLVSEVGLMLDDGIGNADGLGADNFIRFFIEWPTATANANFASEVRAGGGAVTKVTYMSFLPQDLYGLVLLYGIGTRWSNWSAIVRLLGTKGDIISIAGVGAGSSWTPVRHGLYGRTTVNGRFVSWDSFEEA